MCSQLSKPYALLPISSHLTTSFLLLLLLRLRLSSFLSLLISFINIELDKNYFLIDCSVTFIFFPHISTDSLYT